MTESVNLGGDFEKLPKGKLTEVGDVVQGIITKVKQIQQRDVKSKELKFWAPKGSSTDGRPVGLSVVQAAPAHLQELYRPVMDLVLEIDEKVSVYCSADLLKKLTDEAKAVANGVIAVGGQIGIRLDELKDTGAPSPKKLHTVKYVPPTPSVSL